MPNAAMSGVFCSQEFCLHGITRRFSQDSSKTECRACAMFVPASDMAYFKNLSSRL